MFHVPMLEQVGRVPLPTGLLADLLAAARAGNTELSLIICDQLAPAYGSNDRYIPWGGTIQDVLRGLLSHCPPSSVQAPVVTMAPDERDWERCPPDRINAQWKDTIHAFPGWSNVAFMPISRNDFYRELPKVAAVIHTRSMEPYANLLITVNPARSKTLHWIPKTISPELAELISVAGHSQGIVIGSKNALNAIAVPPRIAQFRVQISVSMMVEELSAIWLPDGHAQMPTAAIQHPLAFCGSADDRVVAKICSGLIGDWKDPRVRQSVGPGELNDELADPRTIAVITAEEDETDLVWLMKNGISGHNGGF